MINTSPFKADSARVIGALLKKAATPELSAKTLLSAETHQEHSSILASIWDAALHLQVPLVHLAEAFSRSGVTIRDAVTNHRYARGKDADLTRQFISLIEGISPVPIPARAIGNQNFRKTPKRTTA